MKFSKELSAWLAALAAAATVVAADQTLPSNYRTVATIVVTVLAALISPRTKP
jgi:hypothetical protein